MEGIVLNAKKDLIKTLADLDGNVSGKVSNLTGLAMSKIETSNQNSKDHFEQTRIIQKITLILFLRCLLMML